MALSCAELRQRLDADERLDAPDVREHVAGCVGCRRAFERWRAAMGEMRSWSEEPPPPFLHTRIMSGLRAAAKGERRGWRAWFAQQPVWASSALAAAFVLVVASVVMLRAPLVTHAPASLGTVRERMAASPPAAAEPQPARTTALADKREAMRPRTPALKAAPQTKKDVDRDAWLSRGFTSQQGEAARREDLGFEGSQAPGAAQDASAAAAVAPQGRVSGGIATTPAPRTGTGPAAAAVKETEAATTAHEAASDRAPAQAPEAFRAKTALLRVRARLVPLAGGPARSVEVSPALLAAGPRQIDVDEQGRPQVAAEPARPGAGRGVSTNGRRDAARLSSELSDERSLAQDDLRAINSLRLPPGRYRLERIEE